MNTILTQEHIDFLNDLRESGETNMFGAGSYVQEEFGVTRQEAKQIVKLWMEQF